MLLFVPIVHQLIIIVVTSSYCIFNVNQNYFAISTLKIFYIQIRSQPLLYLCYSCLRSMVCESVFLISCINQLHVHVSKWLPGTVEYTQPALCWSKIFADLQVWKKSAVHYWKVHTNLWMYAGTCAILIFCIKSSLNYREFIFLKAVTRGLILPKTQKLFCTWSSFGVLHMK